MSIIYDEKDDILASGPGVTLAAGDGLIVETGVAVISGGGNYGAVLSGSNHVTVRGTLVGAGGIGEYSGSGGSTVDIAPTGFVSGTVYGILLTAAAATVNNQGIISSNSLALDFGFADGAVHLSNSGTIQANQTSGSYAVVFSFAGTHVVANTGLITNLHSGGIAIGAMGTNGIEQITNKGTINGIISLGTGNDTYDGHLGHHTGGIIDGGGGNDVINCGADKDSIEGGSGSDALAGGNNNDHFIFDTALGPTNIDTIYGFQHGTDKIDIDNFIMTAVGGALIGARFYAAAGATHGHDADDRIVYNTSNGALYYDDDGSGAHASVQFAFLVGHPTLTNTDFVVV